MEMGAGLLKQNFCELAKHIFEKTVMEIIPNKIRHLFDNIILELENPGIKGSEWIVTGSLFELAAYILRDLPGKVDITNQRYERICAMQRMNKVLEYINKNYYKKITIEGYNPCSSRRRNHNEKTHAAFMCVALHHFHLHVTSINRFCGRLQDSRILLYDDAIFWNQSLC